MQGDMLVLCHAADIGSLAEMGTPSGGATWQLLDSAQWPTNTDAGMKIWWKLAGASEPTSYGLTQNSGADGTATVVCLQDPGAGTPVVAHTGGTTSTTSIPTPSTTPNGSNDFELRFAGASSGNGSATSFTPPAGFTERSDVTSGSQYAPQSCATRTLSSGGATGTQNFTSANALVKYLGFTVNVPSGPTTKSLNDAGAASDGLSVAPSESVFQGYVTGISSGSSTTHTVAKPAGTNLGDVLIAAILTNNGDTSADSITGGSAWSKVGGDTWSVGSTFGGMTIWKKTAGGSEPSTYTVTVSNNEASSVVMRIFGSSGGAVTSDHVKSNASTLTFTTPSTSPSVPSTELRIIAARELNSAGNFNATAGFTERIDTFSGFTTKFFLATRNAPAGATGTANFIRDSVNWSDWQAWTINVPDNVTLASLAESGAGTESISLAISPSISDGATAAELLAVTASVAIIESAASVQSLAEVVVLSIAEAGAAAETILAGVAKSAGDAAMATDGLTASTTPALAQSGTAVDALAGTAGVNVSQSAVAADTLISSSVSFKALAEAAAAADILAGVMERNFGPAWSPRRRWSTGPLRRGGSAGTPSRRYSAGPPRTR
ncbi:hypothetical protein [Sphaerisporangium siamense]|uniref:Uncharacterized protein n=1 Tax=Sphaerisporangium siamense TaxID=795645 RepID=A0A7W7DBJ4_9ACTN|nr:hypothetical protein [Sphaerisporangium siamense]MBB4702576.1 hypothetical protein [Sphaerisporangium siamense]